MWMDVNHINKNNCKYSKMAIVNEEFAFTIGCYEVVVHFESCTAVKLFFYLNGSVKVRNTGSLKSLICSTPLDHKTR